MCMDILINKNTTTLQLHEIIYSTYSKSKVSLSDLILAQSFLFLCVFFSLFILNFITTSIATCCFVLLSLENTIYYKLNEAIYCQMINMSTVSICTQKQKSFLGKMSIFFRGNKIRHSSRYKCFIYISVNMRQKWKILTFLMISLAMRPA